MGRQTVLPEARRYRISAPTGAAALGHVPMPDEVHDHAKSEAWNPADLHLRLWTRSSVGSNTYGEDTCGYRKFQLGEDG